MKNINILYFALLCQIGLWSCNSNDANDSGLYIANIEEALSNIEDVKLSDYATDINYYTLETADSCLLGIFSGTLGVVIAWLCTFPINKVIENMTELKNCSHLQLKHAIALVIISTVLTMIGGHIPARMAAKKDAVEALRSE